jgi:hypothetical protein
MSRVRNLGKVKQLLARNIEINTKIAMLKVAYQEQEEVIEQLRKLRFKQGLGYKIIDNFKEKNVSFTTTSVKRYQLKEETKKEREANESI